MDQQRPHYLALDALRGVAALSILIFHAAYAFNIQHLFGHGFLAVDLFFLLSGYVIGAAYEEKLRTGLGLWQFVRIRVIRLAPMIWFGAVLGFINQIYSDHNWHIATFVSSLFAIPFPDATGRLFPINWGEWSLMFELAINACHAALRKWLTTEDLIAIILMGLVGLLYSALYAGSLDLGSGAQNWPGGLSRALFSYFLGVLLWRLTQGRVAVTIPYGVGITICLLLFCIPGFDRASLTGAIRDIATVTIVFPVLILGFVSIRPSGFIARLSKTAGEFSYPVYAIQQPLLKITVAFLHIDAAPLLLRVVSMIVTCCLIIAASYVVLRSFDEPIRTRLSHQVRTSAT